jgi:hypothetical protein
MKQAAVSELEGVLSEISKLLKGAKATFRKNRYCVHIFWLAATAVLQESFVSNPRCSISDFPPCCVHAVPCCLQRYLPDV